MTCYGFERPEVIHMLEILDCKLKVTPLPTRAGTARTASADEFMLMHHDTESNSWGFKHRQTRNYVFLLPVGHELYELYVPQLGELFMRGFFDYEEWPPTPKTTARPDSLNAPSL